MPPLDCANLVGCPVKKSQPNLLQNESKFDTFDLLNPVTAGVQGPQQFGIFDSNVSSGATYQATDWLCSAPNTPYTVSVNEITPAEG